MVWCYQYMYESKILIKPPPPFFVSGCLHLHLSLNHRGCWGTTDDFTTSVLHFSLFSTALWDLAIWLEKSNAPCVICLTALFFLLFFCQEVSKFRIR